MIMSGGFKGIETHIRLEGEGWFMNVNTFDTSNSVVIYFLH